MKLADRRVLILGASRGLGRALAEALSERGVKSLGLLSRNKNQLEELALRLLAKRTDLKVDTYACDLSHAEDVSSWLPTLLGPDAVWDDLFYCAGGGCYGSYGKQKMNSHQWVMQVNLLTPMALIHHCLQQNANVSQLMIVGSAIAETALEPEGASYAAAKSGLKALIQSIKADPSVTLGLHLFSPGFIDTDLVPQGSWPRGLEGVLLPPQVLAHEMLERVYPTPILG